MAEHSETAFFIIGGALAAFAVIVASLGISRPAFATQVTARAVMGVGALLAAGSMIAMVAVS